MGIDVFIKEIGKYWKTWNMKNRRIFQYQANLAYPRVRKLILITVAMEVSNLWRYWLLEKPSRRVKWQWVLIIILPPFQYILKSIYLDTIVSRYINLKIYLIKLTDILK